MPNRLIQNIDNSRYTIAFLLLLKCYRNKTWTIVLTRHKHNRRYSHNISKFEFNLALSGHKLIRFLGQVDDKVLELYIRLWIVTNS